jgi:hypothetical protein
MHNNPYAPPTPSEARPRTEWSDSPAGYLYDRYGMVELAPGATLPEVCAKCGTESQVKRRYIPLIAREDWHYLLLGLGFFPYLAFESTLARGAMWSHLCRPCEKSYDWANRVPSLLAVPLVCWLFGVICFAKADAFETPMWIGLGLIVAALIMAAPVVFLMRTFVPPRVFKYGGPSGLGPWGPAVRVGGIHPRVMEAFLAAHAAKVAEHARYAQYAHAQHAHHAHAYFPQGTPGQGPQGGGPGSDGTP